MVEFSVLITDQAEADLDLIVAFIQQQWPSRVKTDFLASVSQKMQLLSKMPYMYRASEAESTIRECVVNKYVTMYYRIVEEHQQIDILSFKDNRQQSS